MKVHGMRSIAATLFFCLSACASARAQTPPVAAKGSAAAPAASSHAEVAGKSPWGPQDELGALNLMTPESRAKILARLDPRKVYDLSVEYFTGMPGFDALGDPPYQFWLTHTPRGTSVDDPLKVGRVQNDKVSYTGDAVSMYTHMGTHLDSLSHFGLNGEIYNGFKADEYLGDHGWKRNGIEKVPPIVARGVLIDVAALKGVAILPDSYAITVSDLKEALSRQSTQIEPGDVLLVRTGKMSAWSDRARYLANAPGLSLDAARWLAEEKRVMIVGSDAFCPEPLPSPQKDNWLPVHTYLLAQRGVPIIEVIDLEELAREKTYEFAFIAAPLRFRGASAAPFRPVAFAVRK